MSISQLTYVDFNDGSLKLMCVFETTEGRSDGTFTVKSVVSPDDGKNWGPTRSQVFVPSGSGNNGPSLPFPLPSCRSGNFRTSKC